MPMAKSHIFEWDLWTCDGKRNQRQKLSYFAYKKDSNEDEIKNETQPLDMKEN